MSKGAELIEIVDTLRNNKISLHGVNLKEINIGSQIRIKKAKIWKGIWTVKTDYGTYIIIKRTRSNGRKWELCVDKEYIYELIINPSRRHN